MFDDDSRPTSRQTRLGESFTSTGSSSVGDPYSYSRLLAFEKREDEAKYLKQLIPSESNACSTARDASEDDDDLQAELDARLASIMHPVSPAAPTPAPPTPVQEASRKLRGPPLTEFDLTLAEVRFVRAVLTAYAHCPAAADPPQLLATVRRPQPPPPDPQHRTKNHPSSPSSPAASTAPSNLSTPAPSALQLLCPGNFPVGGMTPLGSAPPTPLPRAESSCCVGSFDSMLSSMRTPMAVTVDLDRSVEDGDAGSSRLASPLTVAATEGPAVAGGSAHGTQRSPAEAAGGGGGLDSPPVADEQSRHGSLQSALSCSSGALGEKAPEGRDADGAAASSAVSASDSATKQPATRAIESPVAIGAAASVLTLSTAAPAAEPSTRAMEGQDADGAAASVLVVSTADSAAEPSTRAMEDQAADGAAASLAVATTQPSKRATEGQDADASVLAVSTADSAAEPSTRAMEDQAADGAAAALAVATKQPSQGRDADGAAASLAVTTQPSTRATEGQDADGAAASVLAVSTADSAAEPSTQAMDQAADGAAAALAVVTKQPSEGQDADGAAASVLAVSSTDSAGPAAESPADAAEDEDGLLWGREVEQAQSEEPEELQEEDIELLISQGKTVEQLRRGECTVPERSDGTECTPGAEETNEEPGELPDGDCEVFNSQDQDMTAEQLRRGECSVPECSEGAGCTPGAEQTNEGPGALPEGDRDGFKSQDLDMTVEQPRRSDCSEGTGRTPGAEQTNEGPGELPEGDREGFKSQDLDMTVEQPRRSDCSGAEQTKEDGELPEGDREVLNGPGKAIELRTVGDDAVAITAVDETAEQPVLVYNGYFSPAEVATPAACWDAKSAAPAVGELPQAPSAGPLDGQQPAPPEPEPGASAGAAAAFVLHPFSFLQKVDAAPPPPPAADDGQPAGGSRRATRPAFSLLSYLPHQQKQPAEDCGARSSSSSSSLGSLKTDRNPARSRRSGGGGGGAGPGKRSFSLLSYRPAFYQQQQRQRRPEDCTRSSSSAGSLKNDRAPARSRGSGGGDGGGGAGKRAFSLLSYRPALYQQQQQQQEQPTENCPRSVSSRRSSCEHVEPKKAGFSWLGAIGAHKPAGPALQAGGESGKAAGSWFSSSKRGGAATTGTAACCHEENGESKPCGKCGNEACPQTCAKGGAAGGSSWFYPRREPAPPARDDAADHPDKAPEGAGPGGGRPGFSWFGAFGAHGPKSGAPHAAAPPRGGDGGEGTGNCNCSGTTGSSGHKCCSSNDCVNSTCNTATNNNNNNGSDSIGSNDNKHNDDVIFGKNGSDGNNNFNANNDRNDRGGSNCADDDTGPSTDGASGASHTQNPDGEAPPPKRPPKPGGFSLFGLGRAAEPAAAAAGPEKADGGRKQQKQRYSLFGGKQQQEQQQDAEPHAEEEEALAGSAKAEKHEKHRYFLFGGKQQQQEQQQEAAPHAEEEAALTNSTKAEKHGKHRYFLFGGKLQQQQQQQQQQQPQQQDAEQPPAEEEDAPAGSAEADRHAGEKQRRRTLPQHRRHQGEQQQQQQLQDAEPHAEEEEALAGSAKAEQHGKHRYVLFGGKQQQQQQQEKAGGGENEPPSPAGGDPWAAPPPLRTPTEFDAMRVVLKGTICANGTRATLPDEEAKEYGHVAAAFAYSLRSFYTVLAAFSITDALTTEALAPILETQALYFLPKSVVNPTPKRHLRTVIVFSGPRFAAAFSPGFDAAAWTQYLLAMLEVVAHDEPETAGARGVVVVCDLQGLGRGFLRLLKRLSAAVAAYPAAVEKVLLLNASVSATVEITAYAKFTWPSVYGKLHFVRPAALSKHLHPNLIPAAWGGDCDMNYEVFVATMQRYLDGWATEGA
ncbi:hypothetical protein DIPPA_16665 [Diplonema papillatum]|nr:hypothetical protein DIPPA_16665 [Diplonema papillatum]